MIETTEMGALFKKIRLSKKLALKEEQAEETTENTEVKTPFCNDKRRMYFHDISFLIFIFSI